MNILFAKCFGIGNAVMAVPALKALRRLYPDAQIDILVGSTPDDIGAREVMELLCVQGRFGVCVDTALEREYDLAILSIPFDGRWRNGTHFRAQKVMDGRTRPDPSTTGLISWKHHEVVYQLDNIRELGFKGECPDSSFFGSMLGLDNKAIYLGLGYKKDAAGFWKTKHWGNENYAELIKLILREDPTRKVVTTGDMADLQMTIAPIARIVNDSRFEIDVSQSLKKSFQIVASCHMYVGNDTGMMHVAAAANRSVVGLFFLENSIVKSRPWTDWARSMVIDGTKNRETITPMLVFEKMHDPLLNTTLPDWSE